MAALTNGPRPAPTTISTLRKKDINNSCRLQKVKANTYFKTPWNEGGGLGTASALKDKHSIGGPGSMSCQESAPLWGSWGLHGQSRTGTPVGVLGTAWAVKDRHPCGGLKDCIGSQGPAPLWGSRGLQGQSRTGTPVGVSGTAWAVKDRHPCGGLGDSMGSQGPAPLWGSRGQHWQSRISTPMGIKEAALMV